MSAMTKYRSQVVYLLLFLVLWAFGINADKVKRLEKKVRILEAKVYHETSTLRDELDNVIETLNSTEQECHSRVTDDSVKSSSSGPTALESEFINAVGVVKRAFGTEKARIAEHIENVEGDMKILNGTLNARVNLLGKKLDDTKVEITPHIHSIERAVSSMTSDIGLLKQSVNTANEVSKAVEIACNENKNANAIQMEKIDTIINEIQNLLEEQVATSKILLQFAQMQLVNRNRNRFESSLYFILYGNYNWTDARQMCESLGAYLVEVNSEGEHKFLVEMIDADTTLSDKAPFWLGSDDIDSEGVWKWANSNTPLTFTFWREESNEPNGHTNENCLQMYQSNLRHTWNDIRCSRAFHAICEFSD